MRQSNIELLRLISIFLVLIVHTTFRSLGMAECSSFSLLLLAALSVVGVNVFVFITGYFSATPKKTALCQIAFICLFWGIIKIICYAFFHQQIEMKNLFFITDSNWFIPSYICLLFLAPFLNEGCKMMTQKQLRGGVLSLFIIRTWFDWIPPYPSVLLGDQAGHGVLSFIIIYLIARYVKLYGLPSIIKNNGGIVYLSLSIITALLAYVSVKMNHPSRALLYSYNSPFVILASIGLFCYFDKKTFISPTINYLAKSVLSVLLGHTAIFIWYTAQFRYLFRNYSGGNLIAFWTISLLVVLTGCILLDQVRLMIWKPINNYLKKSLSQNDIWGSFK